jgi:hypothetical protein
MADRNEISIPELCAISRKLVDTFFVTHDMYSLLVLALVTVTDYSRRSHHFKSERRVELAIVFVPDLIDFLESEKIIPERTAARLKKKTQAHSVELPQIMQAYVYAAGGLRTKIDVHQDDKKNCCCIS